MDFLTKWVNSLCMVQILCYLGEMLFKNPLNKIRTIST